MFELCGTHSQTHTGAQGGSGNWIVYAAPCHMPHPMIGEISLLAMSSFPPQVPIDQSHLPDRPRSHPPLGRWGKTGCQNAGHDINLYLQLATCNSARNWQLEGSLPKAAPTSPSYLVFTFQRAHLCLQFMLPDWLTCAHQSHGDPGHLLTWFPLWCQLPPHPPAPFTLSYLPPISAHSQVNILMIWHATCNCSNRNSMCSHPPSPLPYLPLLPLVTDNFDGHIRTHSRVATATTSNGQLDMWALRTAGKEPIRIIGLILWRTHTYMCMYASVPERYRYSMNSVDSAVKSWLYCYLNLIWHISFIGTIS